MASLSRFSIIYYFIHVKEIFTGNYIQKFQTGLIPPSITNMIILTVIMASWRLYYTENSYTCIAN